MNNVDPSFYRVFFAWQNDRLDALKAEQSAGANSPRKKKAACRLTFTLLYLTSPLLEASFWMIPIGSAKGKTNMKNEMIDVLLGSTVLAHKRVCSASAVCRLGRCFAEYIQETDV